MQVKSLSLLLQQLKPFRQKINQNVTSDCKKQTEIQSALGELSEQSFRLDVFEDWDEVDLKDLGESLRQSRSHEVFPVQKEKNGSQQSELVLSGLI